MNDYYKPSVKVAGGFFMSYTPWVRFYPGVSLNFQPFFVPHGLTSNNRDF